VTPDGLFYIFGGDIGTSEEGLSNSSRASHPGSIPTLFDCLPRFPLDSEPSRFLRATASKVKRAGRLDSESSGSGLSACMNVLDSVADASEPWQTASVNLFHDRVNHLRLTSFSLEVIALNVCLSSPQPIPPNRFLSCLPELSGQGCLQNRGSGIKPYLTFILPCCRRSLHQRFLQLQPRHQLMDRDQLHRLGPLAATYAQPCRNARRAALSLLRLCPGLRPGRSSLGR
jgi:hypothetical protein